MKPCVFIVKDSIFGCQNYQWAYESCWLPLRRKIMHQFALKNLTVLMSASEVDGEAVRLNERHEL